MEDRRTVDAAHGIVSSIVARAQSHQQAHIKTDNPINPIPSYPIQSTLPPLPSIQLYPFLAAPAAALRFSTLLFPFTASLRLLFHPLLKLP